MEIGFSTDKQSSNGMTQSPLQLTGVKETCWQSLQRKYFSQFPHFSSLCPAFFGHTDTQKHEKQQ